MRGTRMDHAIDVEDICRLSSFCCFQCQLIFVVTLLEKI